MPIFAPMTATTQASAKIDLRKVGKDIYELLTYPGRRSFKQHARRRTVERSEEHTSELQSLRHLVCRLLLEKKTFSELAIEAGVDYRPDGDPPPGLGVSVADYDGDGRCDIYKTNFVGNPSSLFFF